MISFRIRKELLLNLWGKNIDILPDASSTVTGIWTKSGGDAVGTRERRHGVSPVCLGGNHSKRGEDGYGKEKRSNVIYQIGVPPAWVDGVGRRRDFV